jgi:hypothetical protein
MKNLLSFVLLGAAVAAHAQIVNGDFESGDAGFGTEYAHGSLYDEGVLVVGADAHDYHGSWSSFGDHTTGSGKMLIVNGAVAADKAFWTQSVSLAANTTYDLSLWGASTYPASPAQIKLLVNGASAGVSPAFSSTSGAWNQYRYRFTTGATGSYALRLEDTELAASGNDFAIDDIKVQAVPEPASFAALGAGALALLRRRRK